jgi:hypothetical protein
MISWKSLSKLSCICLSLEKLFNGKYFPVKEKFGLVFRKVFSFYFGRKTFFRSCEKFRNIMLFADYIKFSPQIFDCYIFCFEFFLFYLLEFNLIWFLYHIWSSFFWLIFILFEIIYEIVFFLISSSFNFFTY